MDAAVRHRDGTTRRQGATTHTDRNFTPLIDVMLVLLIMLIITVPLVTNISKLNLPLAAGPAEPRSSINMEIDFDGTIVWNGAVVGIEQLERYLRIEAARESPPRLHVLPDKRAKYDTVARVFALARRSGMKEIVLTSRETPD